MDMAEVKAFNAELSALYDNRPPISKAKMGAITRGAIKAIKFYKHVVHSVEKFILKCKPEYKIPGLYVIDSIVRQSRHQFGPDKDVFAPRFAKNMQQTFVNLLRCPSEDKRNIIRVLNLWQKNNVFTPEVVQPLFDMADPNHPIHQELLTQQSHTNGSAASGNAESKNSPSANAQHTPNMSHGEQMRQIQQLLRGHDGSSSTTGQQQTPINFNRRLLNVDFEYESEDEGVAGDSSPNIVRNNVPNSAAAQPLPPPPQNPTLNTNYMMNVGNMQSMHPQDTLGSILTNPEILRHLQSLQTQMLMANFPMQQTGVAMSQDMNFIDTSQPPPAIHKMDENNPIGTSPLLDEVNNESDIEFVDDAGPQVIEIDGNDSRSPSPKNSRRRRSRSRDISRRSRSRSRRNSRSRSRDRRRRSRDRSRDRNNRDKPRDRERDKEREKEKEREREKDRERRKKGLPPIKKDTLSVCSTTLWVGHLSKLVQAEELSDTFGAIGDVISIDLVSPRGCAFIVMNRRRDASRAIAKLGKHKMHGKAITVAWAPGKGVKGREWKDFWEAEAGACYIPWSRLPSGPDDGGGLSVLDALEEGGVMDEETIPLWLQRKFLNEKKTIAEHTLAGMIPANQSGMMVMSPLQPPQSLGVDTSCLPPPLASLGYAPHPALPMPLPLLGFKPSPQPGLQQALHLQAVLAHQQQQQQIATQLLLAPPRLPPHPPHPLTAMGTPLQSSIPVMDTQQDDAMEIETADDAHSEGLLPKPNMLEHDPQLTEKLKALVANPPPSFNIPPPVLPGQGLLGKPPLLSSQSFPVTSQPPPSLGLMAGDHSGALLPVNQLSNDPKDRDNKRDRDNIKKDRDRRDRDRDRDRTRDRHDRDHNRDRDRDRDGERLDRERHRDRGDKEKERGLDKERLNRDRDRERPSRDRNNRWAGRDHNMQENRDQSPNTLNRHLGPVNNPTERSLQDRLWEMANGSGPRPQQRPDSPQRLRNDRPLKDAHIGDSLLGDGPSDLERRKMMHQRDSSPNGMMTGPNGPIGPMGGPMGPIGPNGPLGPIGGIAMIGGPNMPLMGRSPLPPMAPFRIGRDDIRMRAMGPRVPPMRPGMWIDGPSQYGPRFNGGPPFNRSFDGPNFDRSFDGPPYDRSFDRPHFDNPSRSQFDGPPFENSRFDGPNDNYFERNVPRSRGHRNSDRRGRDRDNDNRSERPPRGSRWTENESPEKPSNKSNHLSNKDSSESDAKPKESVVVESKLNSESHDDVQDKSSETKNRLECDNEIEKEENIVNKPETLIVAPPDQASNIENEFENPVSKVDSIEAPDQRSDRISECGDGENSDQNAEGRGTPCRDELVGTPVTSSDLTNP